METTGGCGSGYNIWYGKHTHIFLSEWCPCLYTRLLHLYKNREPITKNSCLYLSQNNEQITQRTKNNYVYLSQNIELRTKNSVVCSNQQQEILTVNSDLYLPKNHELRTKNSVLPLSQELRTKNSELNLSQNYHDLRTNNSDFYLSEHKTQRTKNLQLSQNHKLRTKNSEGLFLSEHKSQRGKNFEGIFYQQREQKTKNINSQNHVEGRPASSKNPSWSLSVALVAVVLAMVTGLAGGESRSPRVVTTKYGQLRGSIRSLGNKDLRPVEVFLGVPYATPPTGSNRFSPTRTPSPWSGERLADQYGPVCPQHLPELWGDEAENSMPRSRLRHLRRLANYLTQQAEDCLYLNLYVPALVADSEGHGALPVVVFIHGESYEWGAANPYDGSVLAAHGEVIVITLNYRLGPLGFLNTNADPSGRGHVMNHGLMDQIAALHWIQHNIGAFGGDPGSVTLLGHGTGAACIHFLMTSAAVTPDQFQRAVLMSGSALSPWASVNTPTHYAIQFGTTLNCTKASLHQPNITPSNKDLDDMVNCLKDKPLQQLQAVHIDAPQFLPAFGPSVDGIVIKKDYRREIRKRAAEDSTEYDLMFGVVPLESFNTFTNTAIQAGLSVQQRDRILRTMVRNSYDYHLNEVFISAVNEYTDWQQSEPDPTEVRNSTISALSDAQYVAPLITAATNLRMGHRNQFFYVFDHNIHQPDDPIDIRGTVHGAEIPLVLGAPLVGELGVYTGNWTRQDLLVSQVMLTIIANFARNGNPNVRPDQELAKDTAFYFKNLKWEKYEPLHQNYLSISLRPMMRHHYRAHQLALWMWLVPRLQRVGRLEFLTLRDPEAEDEDPKELLQELTVIHHLYTNFDDPDLYSGAVRPVEHMAGHYIIPSTTTTTTTTTTTPLMFTKIFSTAEGPRVLAANETRRTEAPKPEDIPESHITYSTALSVTITIGVSLLVLNILIFAGVYYRRERQKYGNKQEQQSQQTSQSSSEQQMVGISSTSVPLVGSTMNLDVTKAPLTATSSLQYLPPSPMTHSQVVTHISECPPAFADPPMKHSVSMTPLTIPNGNATMVSDPHKHQQQLQQLGYTHQHLQNYPQQKPPDIQHQNYYKQTPKCYYKPLESLHHANFHPSLEQQHQTQQQVLGQHQHPYHQHQASTLPRPPPPPRLGSSDSQPLLPVQVPAPPKSKIPPYDDMRL